MDKKTIFGQSGGGIKHSVLKFARLEFEMLFYSIVSLIVTMIIMPDVVGKGDAIKHLLPMLYGCWYVRYYCIFLLLIPFINTCLNSLNQNKTLALCLTLIVFWSIIPTITVDGLSYDEIMFFTITYCVGYLIRKYSFFQKIKRKIWISILILSALILISSVLCIDYISFILNEDSLLLVATRFREYNMFPAFLFGLSLFMIFMALSFNSSIINKIAGTTTAVYLLHNDTLIDNLLWNKISPNAFFVNSPLVIIHVFIKCLLIFIVCSLIGLVSKKIVLDNINPHLDNIVKKQYQKLSNALEIICRK